MLDEVGQREWLAALAPKDRDIAEALSEALGLGSDGTEEGLATLPKVGADDEAGLDTESGQKTRSTGWSLGADQTPRRRRHNGAVVNDCSFPVHLTFEVPVDNDGTCNFCVDVFLSGYINFPMTVQSYWGSHASFSCAENYLSPSWDVGYLSTDSGTFFLNTYPTTTGFSINLIDDASGGALELDCTNIPPGAGIANINWNLGVQSSATP